MSSIQFTGLADGPECDLDARTRDLISSTVVTRPNPSSKTGGDSRDGLVGLTGQVGVNPSGWQ